MQICFYIRKGVFFSRVWEVFKFMTSHLLKLGDPQIIYQFIGHYSTISTFYLLKTVDKIFFFFFFCWPAK